MIEFKIDKPGRYRTRNGREIHVLYRLTDDDNYPVVGIDEGKDVSGWGDNGKWILSETSEPDLVEYLGPITDYGFNANTQEYVWLPIELYDHEVHDDFNLLIYGGTLYDKNCHALTKHNGIQHAEKVKDEWIIYPYEIGKPYHKVLGPTHFMVVREHKE